MENKHIAIIGGGINGLCSAYYLQQSGYRVSIIDPTFSEAGTSYGNAGMIVPSHFIPMASPGIIAKGMKWMFNSSSPFYIKPRMSLALIQWLWKFTRHCTAANVDRASELIWEYNKFSKRLYSEISTKENFDFQLKNDGLLMLFNSEKGRKSELDVAERASNLGLEVREVDEAEVQALNPNTKVTVKGGVFYPNDAHLYSNRFMTGLSNLLLERMVDFIKAEVKSIDVQKQKVVRISLSNKSILEPEEIVVTAGAWSARILRMMGIKMLLEDGKGYSITQKNIDPKPTIPSILSEEKVAITPMGKDLRITGTLEISGLKPNVNHRRVQGFLQAVPNYFPQVKVKPSYDDSEIWTGFRPLSIDGLPYVGRSQKIENLVVATGHGMMGMSLGPASGYLVNQIIEGHESPIDLKLLRVER